MQTDRWLMASVYLIVGGGCQGEVCDDGTCREMCEEVLAVGLEDPALHAQLDPQNPRLLSMYEFEALDELLVSLRRGVRRAPDVPHGLCVGAQRCSEEVLPTGAFLEPGSYHIETTLVPPLAGAHEVVFRHQCKRWKPGTDPESGMLTEERYTLRARADGAGVRLSPLLTVRVPPTATDRFNCTYSLTSATPVPLEELHGTYEYGVGGAEAR